jgi:hypothetical protein
VEDAAYTIRGKLYLNCYWVYLELLSPDDGGTDYKAYDIFYATMIDAYLSYPACRVSFQNMGDFIQALYYTAKENIKPSLAAIDMYLNNQITKMDLAQVFDSLALQKALQDIIGYAEDFISISREFDQRMKSVIISITSAYKLIFATTLPIVDKDTLYTKFPLIMHGLQSGLPQHKLTLDAFMHNPNWGELYETYVTRILLDYTNAIEEVKDRLPVEIDELDKSFAISKKDFVAYLEENEMNQVFFM